MDPSLKIAVYQGVSIEGDVEANLQKIEALAQDSAKEGADILLMPECFLTGYFQKGDLSKIAQKVDEKVIDALQEIAIQNQIALVVGYFEQDANQIHNSAIFIAPVKTKHPVYRKRQLYGDWEKENFTKGDLDVIFKYHGFNISMLICFDIEFPEHARRIAQKGADLLLIPTSLMKPADYVAQIIVRARALENQIFIAYANRVGSELDFEYVGQSCVIAPNGEELARADNQSEILLFAEIKKSKIDDARREVNYLKELD